MIFLADEVLGGRLVLHRSEPIMYKMGSRKTALAGVHLGGGGAQGSYVRYVHVHKREACISSTFFSVFVAMNVTAHVTSRKNFQ